MNIVTQRILAVILVLFTQHALAKPVKEVNDFRFVMDVDGHQLSVPYYSNHDIHKGSNKINRIVLTTHGAGRTLVTGERLTKYATKLGVNQNIMIIAPQFLIEEDVEKHKLANDVAFWKGGWREGDQSLSTKKFKRPASISSYEVSNKMVRYLLKKNPNVKTVVFTGQSAGGQITQRFAAGSMIEDELAAKGIKVRYVLSNPSTYVYLDKKRRIAGSVNQFAEPNEKEVAACPNYNEYKLGLDDINEFMTATGINKIRENYSKRDIVYFMSGNDNDPTHYQLEKSCGALLQGAHRLERGTIHYNYAKKYYNDPKVGKKTLVVVPEFGHGSKVLATECGAKFLFDLGKCDHIK